MKHYQCFMASNSAHNALRIIGGGLPARHVPTNFEFFHSFQPWHEQFFPEPWGLITKTRRQQERIQ
jgi:hypothetical protein